MRAREIELRSFVESVAKDGSCWTGALDRVLDVLDDFDTMVRLAGEWPIRRILGIDPGQIIDRWGITVRASERAECDPEFRRVLLRNPRSMSALAYFEGLGIPPASYLWQVRKVTVLEETPELHYVVLPACHNGCKTLERRHAACADGPCKACGKPRENNGACAQVGTSNISTRDRIHEVDENIVRLVQADPSTRQRVLLDATNVFGEIAMSVFNVCPDDLGIREVRVAEETESSVFLVLLASRKPHLKSDGSCKAMKSLQLTQ